MVRRPVAGRVLERVAAVGLIAIVLAGCVRGSAGPTPPLPAARVPSSPPATPGVTASGERVASAPPSDLPSPTATPEPSRSPARIGPSPSSGPTALALTIDRALEDSLPASLGSVPLVRRSLEVGGNAPVGLSDELFRELLVAAGRGERDLSVSWAEAAPGDADRTLGLTIVAIRIRGAQARALRTILVGDRLRVASGTGYLSAGEEMPGRASVFAGNASVGTTGDTLLLWQWPDLDPVAATQDPATLGWTYEDLLAALPGTDPLEPLATMRPLPSVEPIGSLAPAPAAVALLPRAIRGLPLETLSGNVRDLLSGSDPAGVIVALPAYLLVSALDLDPARLSAALGHADGLSSFVVIATVVPGVSARRLVGAYADFLARNGGSDGIELLSVDGRPVEILRGQAIHARDGVLYWMTYLDLGDSFGATPEPRPDLRDLVIDTVRALP